MPKHIGECYITKPESGIVKLICIPCEAEYEFSFQNEAESANLKS